MAEYEKGKLYKLSELDDFEVADDDPDVTGWDVYASDEKKIGEVEDLIVDVDSMKVRYLDVKVNDDISGVENHHMLLPIGTASIDQKKDVIRANNVEVVTLLKFPKYEGGSVTRDHENEVRKSYNPEYESKSEEKEDDYYNNEYYDEEKFYSSRRNKRLFRLHEMHGYEIKGADPDIRDWPVFSKDGKRIGRIYELIVDPEVKRIRYIEVASEMDRGSADEDSHILIPVGLTSVDENEDQVKLRMDYNDLSRYPLFRGGEITRTYEDSLRNSIRMDSLTSKDPDEEYYNDPSYNDEGFYGRRGSGVRWV